MVEVLSDLKEARKENASLKDKAAKINHNETHADSGGRLLTGAWQRDYVMWSVAVAVLVLIEQVQNLDQNLADSKAVQEVGFQWLRNVSVFSLHIVFFPS